MDFFVLNFTPDKMSVLDQFLSNPSLIDAFLQNCSIESRKASTKIEKNPPALFVRIDEKDLTEHLKKHQLINGFIFTKGCHSMIPGKIVFGPAGNKFSDV